MVQKIATLDEFNKVLEDAKTAGKLVVVDFTATWCGPCQYIKPKFQALSEKETDVVFVAVDVDENEETSAKCGISCMPTFQYFKDGQKVDELQGANEDKLIELIAKNK